jgi:hypothetical protein
LRISIRPYDLRRFRFRLQAQSSNAVQGFRRGDEVRPIHRALEDSHELTLEGTMSTFGPFPESISQAVWDVLDREIHRHTYLGKYVAPIWI